jgi:predicted MFS family arabinose efflux permease
MMAFAPGPWMVYVGYSIISGIGHSLIYFILTVMLNIYFENKRGIAVGVAFSGLSVGLAAFVPAIEFVYSGYGYTMGIVVLACITMHISVCGALFRDPRKAEQQKIMGKIEKQNIPHSTTVPEVANTQRTSCGRYLHAFITQTGLPLLANGRYLAFCVLSASVNGILIAHLTYLSALVIEVCYLSDANIAAILSLGALCGVLSRIVTGFVTDLEKVRRHHLEIFAFLGIGLGISFACLSFAKSTITMGIVNCLYYVFFTSLHSQSVALFGDILQPEHIPTGVAISKIFQGIASFVWPTILGLMKDNIGQYFYGFILLGILHVIFNLIFAVVIRFSKVHKSVDIIH